MDSTPPADGSNPAPNPSANSSLLMHVRYPGTTQGASTSSSVHLSPQHHSVDMSSMAEPEEQSAGNQFQSNLSHHLQMVAAGAAVAAAAASVSPNSDSTPEQIHSPAQQQARQRAPSTTQHHHGHDHDHEGGGQQTAQPESFSGYFNHLLGENPELRTMLGALEKYIPFVVLLIVKLFFDHGTGIVVFVCLLLTFFHANSVVRAQVQRQARRNIWALLAVFVNLVACICFIYFVFYEDQIYNIAIFLSPPGVDSLYDLIWLVGVNDFILKFVAVILKIFLVVIPTRFLPYQKRGTYFLCIERFFKLWRELAPIQVWLIYLLNGYEKIPGKVLGVILVAAYMVAKGKFLLSSAKQMKVAAEKVWTCTSYGRAPTRDQIKSVGDSCPICYDSFRIPTALHCKHIFCEECLATWFDRERTCPLCRAQVTEDPEWRDGSTSQFIQLF